VSGEHPTVTTPLLPELSAYAEHDPALDRRLWARPVVPEHDTPLLTAWMNKPHVAEFWAMAWPQDWIRDYLVRQVEDPARSPYLGFVDDAPVGYIEVYDPHRDVLGAHAPVREGDLGAHVLIGEEEHLGRYSVAVGRAVARFLFSRPDVLRLVGEPDVTNQNFLSLLSFLGFRKEQEIQMPDKVAAFMVCERRDFERLSSRRRRVTR
jgi:acetyl CoA:N6-hydroxylysine acetyl transferase